MNLNRCRCRKRSAFRLLSRRCHKILNQQQTMAGIKFLKSIVSLISRPQAHRTASFPPHAIARVKARKHDVRFPPESGHVQCNSACRLSANSGHCALHSITSSARASSEGAMIMPSALAVVRLMKNSNLVGWSGHGRCKSSYPLTAKRGYSAATLMCNVVKGN